MRKLCKSTLKKTSWRVQVNKGKMKLKLQTHRKLALTTDLDLATKTAYIPISSLKPFTFNNNHDFTFSGCAFRSPLKQPTKQKTKHYTTLKQQITMMQ